MMAGTFPFACHSAMGDVDGRLEKLLPEKLLPKLPMKELLKLGLEGLVEIELVRLSGLVGEVGDVGVARPR